MPRDVYEPPPPRHTPAVSRRAFLGLGRVRAEVDYDNGVARARPPRPAALRRVVRRRPLLLWGRARAAPAADGARVVRVVRPGGVVAFTAWVPRGLPGRADELVERPEGIRAPSDWGRQDVMTERLAPLLDGLELRTRTV